jgi:ribosome biogenesis protein Nip4
VSAIDRASEEGLHGFAPGEWISKNVAENQFATFIPLFGLTPICLYHVRLLVPQKFTFLYAVLMGIP